MQRFLACAADCDRTEPSLHALSAVRVSKRNELLNIGQRQVGAILVDFLKRRTKLGVLNDSISENACAAHDGAARHLDRV